MIKHSTRWLREEAERHGLILRVGEKLYGQTWVIVRRAPVS